MFLHNKYTTWYYTIINHRVGNKPDVYSEKHHIIPKSLGGSNDQSNLVHLTAREHFLIHWLLTKMCEGKARKKMYFAMYSLSWARKNSGRIVSSWQYAEAKKAKSKGMRGNNNPIHLRDITGERNPFFGRNHSQETRDKISKSQKKRLSNPSLRENHSKKMKGKLAGEKHPFYGKSSTKGKTWVVVKKICPNCGKIGGANNMKRWHFDNCKFIYGSYPKV